MSAMDPRAENLVLRRLLVLVCLLALGLLVALVWTANPTLEVMP